MKKTNDCKKEKNIDPESVLAQRKKLEEKLCSKFRTYEIGYIPAAITDKKK